MTSAATLARVAALVLVPATGRRTGLQDRAQLAICPSSSLQGLPPGPFEARASSPPGRQARRHWYTDLVLTRKDRAICLASASCANIFAACSRTCSRRDPALRG